jgi:hypothetical protein
VVPAFGWFLGAGSYVTILQNRRLCQSPLSSYFCQSFAANLEYLLLKIVQSLLTHLPTYPAAQGGGEKRKLLSEKTEKTWRKRKIKLLLESDLFSRKLFSGENPNIGFLLEKRLFCTGRTR